MLELNNFIREFFSIAHNPFFDKLYAVDRITQYFAFEQDVAENGEEIETPYAEISEILQPYRNQGINHKGSLKVDSIKTTMRRLEINWVFNPNAVVGKYGKHLSNLIKDFHYEEDKHPIAQKISIYIYDQILKQSREDRLKKMLLNGVWVDPPATGAAPASTIYDGLLTIKNRLVTEGRVTAFPMGALPTGVGLRWKYLSDLLSYIPDEASEENTIFFVCKGFFDGVIEDLLDKSVYNGQYGIDSATAQSTKKSGILDIPNMVNMRLIRQTNMTPADGIIGFLDQNAVIYHNKYSNINDSIRFKELEDGKSFAILGHAHECVGFRNPKYIYSN